MARKKDASPTTAATAVLTKAGVDFETLTYHHDARETSYGLEAARELGLDPAEVFKTLLVHVDARSFAVAVLPVDAKADLKAVAAAVGGKKAEMAAERDVTRVTGYVIGGCSPLGQRTRLPTVIDDSAEQLERIYVSGGRRGMDLGLAPQDLAELTKARFSPITRVTG